MAEAEEEEVGVETSFEELAKRAEDTEEDEEEEIVLDLGRGEEKGAEGLVEKVIPVQANEFTCRNCFLVKHRSQLADRKKMFCVDCA